MSLGWVKIHREIRQWRWYQDIPVKTLFIHFLLQANYTTRQWCKETIRRGQCITSIDHMARDTGLSVGQVRGALKKLKSTGEITIKTTNKYHLITITNYNIYQQDEQTNDKRVTNKMQTDDNKQEGKELKNVKTCSLAKENQYDGAKYKEPADIKRRNEGLEYIRRLEK